MDRSCAGNANYDRRVFIGFFFSAETKLPSSWPGLTELRRQGSPTNWPFRPHRHIRSYLDHVMDHNQETDDNFNLDFNNQAEEGKHS